MAELRDGMDRRQPRPVLPEQSGGRGDGRDSVRLPLSDDGLRVRSLPVPGRRSAVRLLPAGAGGAAPGAGDPTLLPAARNGIAQLLLGVDPAADRDELVVRHALDATGVCGCAARDCGSVHRRRGKLMDHALADSLPPDPPGPRHAGAHALCLDLERVSSPAGGLDPGGVLDAPRGPAQLPSAVDI